MYTCPQCDEEINEATEICPHCAADLTDLAETGRKARKLPLTKILVRWVTLLGVLMGALWFFISYMVKHRIP
jgi:predicted amidophosphoribosyltransferase